jgi:hypothetical protein
MTEEKRKSWWRDAKDKLEAQVDSKRAQAAEGAATAGNRTIEKQFGFNTIEIYDGGFVRVSKMITPFTPYEKLQSIKFQQQTQDRSGVGQAWAGGPLASSQRRTLSLTIATDRKVHALVAEHQMLSGDEKAGLALEAAGNTVLGSIREATPTQVSIVNPPPPPPTAPSAGTDIADQIKKLAELHGAGILTDDEFAAKKADLLRRM